MWRVRVRVWCAVVGAEWQTVAMRASMEGLFWEHRVDAVVAGHVHAYERSHSVYLDQVTEGAPGGRRCPEAPPLLAPQRKWWACARGEKSRGQ